MLKYGVVILLTLGVVSCSMSGSTKQAGVMGYISGSANMKVVKNKSILHITRAIGQPNEAMEISGIQYYAWNYSRAVNISYAIFGGAGMTFVCRFSVETKNGKIREIVWYGNKCEVFLGPIKAYFKDKLNIEDLILEEKPTTSKDERDSVVQDAKTS